VLVAFGQKAFNLLQLIGGILLVRHGLVHWLDLGQRARRFELNPDRLWPGR
jgi:hypothetical protein